MGTPGQTEPQPGFTRNALLRHPDILIESRCAYCGLSIIANAPESLDYQEQEHRKHCKSKAVATTSE